MEHWVDLGNEQEVAAASILAALGLLYFQIQLWQARRKRHHDPHFEPNGHSDRSSGNT